MLDAFVLGVLATALFVRYWEGTQISVDDFVARLMSLLDTPTEIAIGIGAAASSGLHLARVYVRGEVMQELRAVIREMLDEASKKSIENQQPTAELHRLPSSGEEGGRR